jgi:UDPglucose 6-dehydrogenase
MKLVVQGLWHLGCVTAACCARHFDVVGLDFDRDNIAQLQHGKAPLLEPGLNELIAAGLAEHKLRFTADPAEACTGADLLWLAYDTPVNENDESDVDLVLNQLQRTLSFLPAGAIVLISAQLPVGTCAALEKNWPQLHFACSPENLRLGKAIHAFERADRVIVGTRTDEPHARLKVLFAPFTQNLIFMRTESAEMVKHALNSFLALSITFINEISRLGEHVGADAREVSLGLKSEPRIGPRAYLGPGGAFAGGTLARDVVTLSKLGAAHGEKLSVIPAIKQSNDLHRNWALNRLKNRLDRLDGKTVAILGLVYTPGTSTLRRSSAIELCQALLRAGSFVRAFDPAIAQLPPELSRVHLASSAADAIIGSDAAVVCTEWPDFAHLDWATLISTMKRPIIVDANRFLDKQLGQLSHVDYFSVGRS